METCFLCDEACGSGTEFFRHLWVVHTGSACWCGAYLDDSRELGEHLDCMGGAVAHYLEWKLESHGDVLSDL